MNKTKLKICGIKRKEDIAIINKYDIDYVGFVFADSSRKVSNETAAILSDELKRLNNDKYGNKDYSNIIPVGVFVNDHIDRIVNLFADGIISIAQLHGDEDEEYIKSLKVKALEKTGQDLLIIKSIVIKTEDDALKWQSSICDYLLLDSGKGSGKTFNWDLIPNNMKKSFDKPFFLAGGLNSNNLAIAIEEFKPFAVDLSSGVEIDGFKDEKKIKKVVDIVKNI